MHESQPLLRRVDNDEDDDDHNNQVPPKIDDVTSAKKTKNTSCLPSTRMLWFRRLCASVLSIIFIEVLYFFVISSFLDGWINGFSDVAASNLVERLAPPKNQEFIEALSRQFRVSLLMYSQFVCDIWLFFVLGMYTDFQCKKLCGLKVIADGRGAFSERRFLLRGIIKCGVWFVVYWGVHYPSWMELIWHIDFGVLDVWPLVLVLYVVEMFVCVVLWLCKKHTRVIDLLLGTEVVSTLDDTKHDTHLVWRSSLSGLRATIVTVLLLGVGAPVVTYLEFSSLDAK